MRKSKSKEVIAVTELTLKDVITKLAPILPNFANHLKYCEDKNYKFYKADYFFGNKIIHNKKLYLPLTNGDVVAADDPLLPESITNDLNFNLATENPLALVLSKTSEFYSPTESGINSHALIHPGEVFGIPDTRSNSISNWNLNAGARSLFTISRVAAKVRHNKLQQRYGVSEPVPIFANEQWSIFVDIAKAVKSQWRSEILYFPKKWVKQLKDPEWHEMLTSLRQIQYNSNSLQTDSVLADAFDEVEKRKRLNIHYPPFALSTARKLFFIAANSACGFRPAINEESAPIKLLKEAYAKVYGLAKEGHSNAIMEPANFSPISESAIYYSINYPVIAEQNPQIAKLRSVISLLDEVERITSAYQTNLELNHNKIKLLIDIATTIKFSFYHCNSTPQTYKNILNSKYIAKEDSRFTKGHCGKVPEYSPFFKGCIKVEKKRA